MDILILVGNNLQFDTRVKNHIRLIAEYADHVYISARPIPDHTIHIEEQNVISSFFDWNPSEYSCTSKLRSIARRLEIWEILWPVASVLLEDEYYKSEVINGVNQFSDDLMKNEKWDEIRKGIAEEASKEQEMGWVISFLDTSLQWAEKVIDISADIVYCNDIDTLLCGVAHKKKYGSRLIYDVHDIACDMFPRGFPRRYRDFLARYEAVLIQKIDFLISVNESAVRWLKLTYHLLVPGVVVSNCVQELQVKTVAHKMHLPLRLYYHGFCDPSRGIANMIYGISMTEDTELVLRLLPSKYEEELRLLVSKLRLENRVRFLEPVSTEKVILATNEDGDVGIHASDVEECINLQLALTNKFIEYLRAGLPVISVPSVEHSRIIEKYNVGYIIPDNKPETIADALNRMKLGKECYEMMAINALRASREEFATNTHRERLVKAVFNSFTEEESRKQKMEFLFSLQYWSKEIKYLEYDIHFWQNEYLKKFEYCKGLESDYELLKNQMQKTFNEEVKKRKV